MNTLTIPAGLDWWSPWNRTVIYYLMSSGLFTPIIDNLPIIDVGRRRKNFNLLKINDKLIALDTWDSISTIERLEEQWQHVYDTYDHPLRGLSCIIKIGMGRDDAYLREFSGRTGVKVTPLAMFPDGRFPVGAFRWQPGQHDYLANLTGKNVRNKRPEWVAAAIADGRYYAGRREPPDAYTARLRRCRWGVALAGISDKTRREPEFLSCGMPLALNYDPFYPFPFEPGVHYYRLYKPSDLTSLGDVDPRPYAAKSYETWERYFSPVGMAMLLLELIA